MSGDSPQTLASKKRPSGAEPPVPSSLAVQPTVHAQPGSDALAAATHWAGREVAGRYRILELLGEGGMGAVYVAEHINLKKRVAFKVILPELAMHPELLQRFTREALAMGQLDHPHIAAALDFDRLDDGSAFIVMPLVKGHSLSADFESRGALPFKRVCRIGAEIADALSAAHSLGIVHRDLKPDNVLLEQRPDGSECCKVLDFGVASLSGVAGSISAETERPLTQVGMVLGTPGYMSPEQASAGEVDYRTDLYALGVMLWELSSGERLFVGTDLTEIFSKQFNTIPDPLVLGAAAGKREFSTLVAALLASDKSRRPPSAAEVRDTLRRLADMPETSLGIPAVIDRVSIELKQRPKLWLASGAGFVVLLGAAWVSLTMHAAPTSTPGAQPSSSLVERIEGQLSGLPSEVAEAQRKLLDAEGRNARKTAARALTQYKGAPAIEAVFLLAAELELESSCKGKKELIESLGALKDVRALPALDRLADSPRRGCGIIRMNDCFACLRSDLASTIAALEGR